MVDVNNMSEYSGFSDGLNNRDVPDIRFHLAGYLAIFLLAGSGSGYGRNVEKHRILQRIFHILT